MNVASLAPRQALRLATGVLGKARQHRSQLETVWADLNVVVRLVRAWARGQYRSIPWRSLAVAVAALFYVLDPFDAVPDWLPGIGLVDDASMVALLVGSIRSDLMRFLEWEEERA